MSPARAMLATAVTLLALAAAVASPATGDGDVWDVLMLPGATPMLGTAPVVDRRHAARRGAESHQATCSDRLMRS